MPDEQESQFKRNIAYKLKINDILAGKPIINNDRFSFLEFGNRKIIRVNIVGNVVDKYLSEGDKKYAFITIDDGSNQMQLRAFGDDTKRLEEINQGQTILVIGLLRYFNDEVYIMPEIIKILDPKYLLVRKLEIQKQRNQNLAQTKPLEKEKIVAVRENILGLIKNSEESGGIDVDEIIMKPELNQISPDIINQEIKKMLEDGVIFEPRPGRLRFLG